MADTSLISWRFSYSLYGDEMLLNNIRPTLFIYGISYDMPKGNQMFE